ncbi:MAG: SGNH/GDSL hydrolase family protein [Burkholderiales bacterium]|nr:SGNH/GDSL hydrolase family protein [Burkholderiales bacterium]MBK9348021.1 SGNH/GDSL hydrolase family protein [Burkholderiales bacterium]
MKYTTFKHLLCASTLSLCALVSAPAHAFSSLYVFGDSLSDSGNNAQILMDAGQVIGDNSYVPMAAYGSSTYSNGPVWASYFANALGLSATPSLLGGTNFAFGGAQTGTPGVGPGGFPFSMTTQVGMYLGSTAGLADKDALYVIAGGGNNARAAVTDVVTHIGTRTEDEQKTAILASALAYANDEGLMVDALQAAGARHIVVWNAPNLGITPFANAYGLSDLSSGISQVMNMALSNSLKPKGVTTFDLYGVSTHAVNNPLDFGLGDVKNACGAVVNQCDPATAMFWDGIHPTTYGHQLIANAMLAAVPEPQTYAMLLVGLGLIGGAARRRKSA